MEAIAARADISIASLCNSFASKDLVLAALIEDGLSAFVETLDPIYDAAYGSCLEGYMTVIGRHFAKFDGVDRSWLRRFSVHALARIDVSSASYSRLEHLMVAQVARMTGRLAVIGHMRPDEDQRLVSQLVWSVANSEYLGYVASKRMTVAEACRSIRRLLSIALRGVEAH